VLQTHFQKTKVLLFNQQGVFQPKVLWLNFVLNGFDFTPRAKSLSKINLALKKWFATDLSKTILAKRFCLQLFPKRFAKPK